jgi:uncharacterized protein YjgD (DUF1641 family)
MSTIKLDTIGGYNEEVIKNFNRVAKHFDDSGLLIEILSSWADDQDIKSITEHLTDRLEENNINVDAI